MTTSQTRSRTDALAPWAERRIVLSGRPFSFQGHEYLRALYDETAQRIVLSKAAQIGGTVWALLRSIHACLNARNVAYYFPNLAAVTDFSRARVGPLIRENPFLTKTIADTDAVGLKKIGDGFVYLRGMQSTVGLKSIDADMIVFDELDEATPEARATAMERLGHSDYKWVIELSNPSLPGFGVDESFSESDQRHWNLKCPGCGQWACLEREFPLKLGEEVRIIRPRGDGSYYRACPRCEAELDLAAGEWVPDHPGRPVHGYRISQLFSSKVDPGDILRQYERTKYPEKFYNLKIGVAWADLTHRVDMMSVLALCGQDEMLAGSARPCTMGVDTGRELHVVISQRIDGSRKRRLVYVGVHHEYAELDNLMKRFQVICCVIDAMPDIHATRDFARRHLGRVYLNYFVETQKGRTHWDHAQRIVQENRTEILDHSRRVIRDKLVELPKRSAAVVTFAAHMAAIAKRLEENDETGEQRYVYRRSGPDHLSMAFTYNVLAWERDNADPHGLRRIRLGPPSTWRPYLPGALGGGW